MLSVASVQQEGDAHTALAAQINDPPVQSTFAEHREVIDGLFTEYSEVTNGQRALRAFKLVCAKDADVTLPST